MSPSWKISFIGQVDWYFQIMVCARDTCGMATPAPMKPAPARKLRRVGLRVRLSLVLTDALPPQDEVVLARCSRTARMRSGRIRPQISHTRVLDQVGSLGTHSPVAPILAFA